MSAGRIVTVLGASGGAGATTVAAGLAAALAADAPAVLLPLPGDPATDLGVWYPRALQDGGGPPLRESLEALVPELLESAARPAAAGLSLLWPDPVPWSAAETRRLLALAAARWTWVVVDAGAWRGAGDGALGGALGASAETLLVLAPEPPSVRRARLLSPALPRPPRGVLNRARGPLAGALEGLGIAAALPEDTAAAEALIAGDPVRWIASRSPAAAGIRALAAALAPAGAPAAGGALLAAEPAPVEAAARTPAYRALKRQLHRTFLDRARERGGLPAAGAAVDAAAESRVRAELVALVETEAPAAMGAALRDRLVADLADAVLGLGPLQDLLDDPGITEIMVNGPGAVWVERGGRIEPTGRTLDGEEELRGVIERIVAPLGRRIDEASPLVDARLPDGSRVNAVIPPLALDGSVLTIRKFSRRRLAVDDLIAGGSLTAAAASFLKAAVAGRLNLLISGGTGSGKTTLLNVLASFIGAGERIVTIEDAAELQLPQAHVVRLEARPANLEGRGAVTIRDLVRNALRMRPDRIVVGECRGGEALDMLQAMNTGHDGSLSTLHANTPRDGLARLETLVLMAGMDLPVRAIREQAASAVDLIVQVARQKDGGRRVTHVTEVCGLEGDVYRLQDVFRRRGEGSLEGCGLVPRCAERLAERGFPCDPAWFAA